MWGIIPPKLVLVNPTNVLFFGTILSWAVCLRLPIDRRREGQVGENAEHEDGERRGALNWMASVRLEFGG